MPRSGASSPRPRTMAHADAPALTEGSVPPFEGLDPDLREQIGSFETFFKTFGFKRIHGRVWGLLVLSGHPLSSKEVVQELGISQGAASTTLNELQEWGAVQATFDSGRRCHLHEAVGNTMSIVATVLRRREQVAFEQFKAGATRALDVVTEKYGTRDPRVLTLRSIITTCDLADAMMQVIFSSVSSALGDPQSLLSRAMGAAMKFGVGRAARAPGTQPPGDEAGGAQQLQHDAERVDA